MSFKQSLTLAVVVVASLAQATAEARPGGKHGHGGPPSEEMRARFQEQIKTARVEILRDEVGLSGDKLDKVVAVFEKHDTERGDLMKRGKAARDKLRDLVQSKSQDGKALNAAIDEMLKVRNDFKTLEGRQLEEARKLLTAPEMAKLMVVLPQARKRMMRELRSHKREMLQRELHKLDAEDAGDGGDEGDDF